MKRRANAVFCAAAVMVLTGCGGNGKPVDTPEKRAELAYIAGEAAAMTYLAIDKPSDEQAEAIKVVLDKVREKVVSWKEGGFIASLPELEALADELFPGEEKKAYRLAAKKLTKVLLQELDELFKKHPEWKQMGAEVAALVGRFLDGSSDAFKTYIES